MKLVCFALTFLLAYHANANINHIDINKITKDPARVALFRFVVENQGYYAHWTPNWNADKSKVELDFKLRDVYSSFASLPEKNAETFLMLGDVAHYLYNLEVQTFYDSTVANYEKAKKLSPSDFRADWFLAFHYAQSTGLAKAIPLFLQLQKTLPSKVPADFWEEYAWTAGVANMTSHCLFAMEQEKKIKGSPGTFEVQMGDVIRKRLVPIDKDSSYQKQQIWSYQPGEKNVFTSRPLGVKLLIDSTWDVMVQDYAKRFGAFIITPPTLKNKAGTDIHYTIALLMSPANDKDRLEDYLQKFIGPSTDKKKIDFSSKYEQMVTYEIRDKKMYPNLGGGHLYVMGIERNMPAYPGMALEEPAKFPRGKKNEVAYYRAGGSRTRFAGKIFYMIMLDSCEDIHEGSRAVLKELFENQMVIE